MGKEVDEIWSIESDDKNIIIKLPIDFLVFTQKNRPETPYVITNKEKMVEYFKKMFFEFYRGTRNEGETEFTSVIDSFFDEAIESGEPWLDTDDNWMEE